MGNKQVSNKGLKRYLVHPTNYIRALGMRGKLGWIPDKIYLQFVYRSIFGRYIDFKNPVTYTEKLQWMKLYNRRPEYSMMVDKYLVREYVKERIGEQYLIPLLGVWEKVEDIDFSALPDQFVIKCNHDSGSVIVCTDKSKLDEKAARAKLAKHLQIGTFVRYREWPYKNVKPVIIAEQYMEDASTQELRDYKFFVFDGVVKALYIASDRQDKTVDTKFDFFDADYRYLDMRNGHPNAEIPPAKPEHFEEMKQLAAKLAEGMPHARVDFYEVNGVVYFGEITFFHRGGFAPFEPSEWDKTFGEWLHLPSKYEGK